MDNEVDENVRERGKLKVDKLSIRAFEGRFFKRLLGRGGRDFSVLYALVLPNPAGLNMDGSESRGVEGIPVLRVEAVVEDEVRWFSGEPFRLSEERSDEPEESRKPLLLGLPSLEGLRGMPSERVVSMEKVEPTLLVLVRGPLFEVVAALFSHEGGSAGLDNLLVEGKRGRDAGGMTTVVWSSTPSSRCLNSDSRRAPELYDLESGCRWWLTIELIVPTDEADERRDTLSVDRRRVSGDGASPSSLE